MQNTMIEAHDFFRQKFICCMNCFFAIKLEYYDLKHRDGKVLLTLVIGILNNATVKEKRCNEVYFVNFLT